MSGGCTSCGSDFLQDSKEEDLVLLGIRKARIVAFSLGDSREGFYHSIREERKLFYFGPWSHGFHKEEGVNLL